MNPMFSRRNVPPMVRAGLTFLMTALIAPGIAVSGLAATNSLELAVGMLRELMVGLCAGFVFQIFYYMLFFAGDIMDVQFGLSMAKVFDPGTNIQLSMSGSLLNILFMLYLIATDSHLVMVRIFATSFDILPVGSVTFSPDSARFFLDLFVLTFSMVLHLAIPFLAAEFVLELAMGILMKLIPQIHVFVINIQFKLILALVMLFAFARPTASFIDNYMNIMLRNMHQALLVLGS